MQLINQSGSSLIRRNAHSRALWIDFPRIDTTREIQATLFTLQKEALMIHLPVLIAGDRGVRISLPSFLTGIFLVKLRDGNQSITQRVAIQ